MGKEVYFDRIEQEIEYGNYSEVKRIALTILRSNPENKDASYIRDFIEYHKKSNGRYGNISLSSYLYYISRNIEKFRKTADNEMFLSCFYNDLFHTDNYNKGDEFSLNISNSEIKKAMELLRQLSNPDLDKLIKSLDDIQKDFDLRIKRVEQLKLQREQEEKEREQQEQLRKEREKEREKEQKEKTIKIWVVVALLFFIFIMIICSSVK